MKNITCIRLYANPVQIKDCKEKIGTNGRVFSQLAEIFALAGNEARLKILFLLEEEGELCPCDLADILNMTVQAVSQHLRKLRDGEILETRREGQTIYYSLSSHNLKLLKPFFKHITQTINEEVI